MRPAVSNKGRYRSYAGKISKGQIKKNGRHCIHTKNAQGKQEAFILARLVKLTFHGPPDDPTKIDVGHMDNDKTNDELDNLEWQTRQENVKQAMKDPKRSRTKVPPSKEVLYRRKGTTEWTKFDTASALATELGYKTTGVVSELANGNRDHPVHEVRYVEQPDLEGEEWREAVGYDGIRVSNMGRIEYKTGKRSYGSDSEEYKAFQSRQGFIFVHALVMLTFVGPRPDSHDIDHNNGDKHDNRLSNLQYMTRKENNAKRNIDHSLSAKSRGKPVLATKDGVTTRYNTTSEAANDLKLKQSTIAYNADHGKSHGGYLFAREEEETIEGEEWRELTEEILALAKRL